MTIYVRTGDVEATVLSTGQRVSKTCLRVEVYSTLDEPSVVLSLYVCAAKTLQYRQLLENI